MAEQTNNKTIAKNTFFLYFRMMFTMLIALYTSRVILQMLGVDDYGIYQTVGGVAVMLSFVSSSLSAGSSRFLTYELGKGDKDKLERTFSTVLVMHIVLALMIVLLAETVGLWFVYNRLQIPTERIDAAVFAYHFSILTVLATFLQVPFNASIPKVIAFSSFASAVRSDCVRHPVGSRTPSGPIASTVQSDCVR